MIINTRRLDYLNNRRISFIQKANNDIHIKLELLNNNLVDKKINGYNGITNIFDELYIYNTIFALNKPQTIKMFMKIINSPLTNNSKAYQLLTKARADGVTRTISKIETERVLKNLEYIEKTLSQSEVDITKYNKMAKSFPKVNRLNILEKALERGESWKGKEYSYKELEQLSKNLDRYKVHAVDYQEAIDANNEALANGYPPVYTTKTWIWSQLEHTRHSNMDGMTVGLEELFPTTNEVTGDTDNLLFPGDVENDGSGCSNICNCQCTVAFNKD